MKFDFPTIESNEDFSRYFNENFWLEAAREICRRHKISFEELKRGIWSFADKNKKIH